MGYKTDMFKQHIQKDNIMHLIKVSGMFEESFKKDFFKNFTYDWEEYDDETGPGDCWYDIPNVSAMLNCIDDKNIKDMFKDMSLCQYNTAASAEKGRDTQVYEFNRNHDDMMTICNIEKLGYKPVQLLSIAFPTLEFDVLSVDDKGRTGCSRIKNGVLEHMPDNFVKITEFNTSVYYEMSVNEKSKPMDMSNLNVIQRISEPLGSKMVEAPIKESGQKSLDFDTEMDF